MRVLVVSLVMVALGCSSSSGGGSSGDGGTSGAAIDCAWLNDASNCYARFVADVTSCIVGGGGPGILDADNRTCTYPGGDPLITFSTPLGTTIDGGSNGSTEMHFTLTSGGATCLEHTEHKGDFGFTSKGPKGTFQISYVNNAVTVTCPDGSALTGDVSKLTGQCKSDFDTKMPGTYWSETNPTFTFKPGTLIWHCARTR
jgi:hypothetical protein